MTLTLYKNYKFSKNYAEVLDVFGGNDARTAYLNTLDSEVVEYGNSVYLTTSGTLNFDFQSLALGDITRYNYLKMSDDERTVYAFVDNVEILNDIAVLAYTVDFWNTYAPRLLLNDSTRVKSRVIDEENLDFCEIPISARTTKAPNWVKLSGDNYVVLVKYTAYTLGTADEYSYQNTTFGVIWRKTTIDDNYESILTFSEAEQVTRWFTQYPKKITISGKSYDMEVEEIYMVPDFGNFSDMAFLGPYDITSDNSINFQIKEFPQSHGYSEAASYSFKNDKNITNFGAFFNMKEASKDLKTHTMTVSYMVTPFLFSLILGIDGVFQEISENFQLPTPYSPVSAEKLLQNSQNRELKNIALKSQQISSAFSVAGGVTSAILGGVTSNPLGILSGASQIGGGISAMILSTKEQEYNNAPVYRNGNVNTGIYRAYTAASFGVGYQTVEIDNDSQITAAIDSEGYNVFYIEKGFDIPNAQKQEKKFNVIKYSQANIYGAFSENVKNNLRAILENGVKIWYTIPE